MRWKYIDVHLETYVTTPAVFLQRKKMRGSVIFQISWTKVAVQIAVTFLCLVNSVLCGAVMKTSPENATAEVGGAVIFHCQVQDATVDVINWFFVEHNTQISKGNTLLVSSSNKYSFVTPADRTSSTQLNLQIQNIQISDAGHYRCYVTGTTASVSHSLRVEGAPEVPDATPPPANFTDCCLKQNISSSCLPVCTPATVNASTFNALGACASDLPKLLFCFSDNRNHAGCCRRRFVPDICLEFCLDKPPALTAYHMTCLNNSNEIISCFEEGQVLLPGPPTEVSVLAIPISTILVNWKPPISNPSTVTGYRVAHKLVSSASDEYVSSEMIFANTSQFTLMGLLGDKRYEVYVTAIGQHGSSLPSARHIVTVLGDPSSPDQTTDMQACCKSKGVSPWCQVKLCHSSTWSQMNPHSLVTCYSELDSIFHCLAGGRNHTPCCARNNVPQACLDLCSGSPPAFDWSLSQCVLNMPIIDACVQQGFTSLPSAPRLLALKKVTDTTAELEWSPPQSGAAGVKSYLIQLKKVGRETLFTNIESVMTTFIKLTNLEASTEYEARVITVGSNDSSLPSDSVMFLTYDNTHSTTLPPDTGIATVHNITECCAKSNVPSYCLPGCSYDVAQITNFFTTSVVSCLSHLNKILICASDGRDHRKCCTQRNVDVSCHMFCNYTADSPDLDVNQLTCLVQISNILECYEEGITYLPEHPVNVVVVSKTTNTIVVSWEKAPSGPSVDYYVLAYSPDLVSWFRVNVTSTSYILQNLNKDTQYSIEISSVNSNGTSPPSNRITVRTNSGVVVQPPMINGTIVDGRVIWANRQECCSNHNVSQQCIPFCVGQQSSSNPSCINDIASILACTADGRDHTICCRKIGVPESCLSMCQGYHSGKNFITAACIGWARLISACSAGGADIVPSEPRNFSVVGVANKQVRVTWIKPAEHCDGNYTCTYQLHYWRVSNVDNVTAIDGPKANTIKNVTSPYILSALTTFTHYRVTVTAENQYGGSRHSLSQTVYIEYYGIQDLSISQVPNNILEQGSPVKLFCDVVANPTPELVWKKDGKTIQTGHKLTFSSVKEGDSGLYTCEASNRDGKSTVSAFLPVKFKPLVVNHRDATIEPKKSLTATLACWFDGFPDVTSIKWKKDGGIVTARPPKIKEFREIRIHTGVTAVQLKIYNVVTADYGHYTCSASNSYGSASGAVRLIDPTVTPPGPTVTPRPRVANVTACCLGKGIEQDCMVACTYDVDILAITTNPALFKCANHIGAYAECAADGSDHSQCCKQKDVADFCLPFCSGNVPGDSEENIMTNPEMLQCVSHADSIIDCMEENKDNVPNAPQVFAKLVDKHIKVTWSPPTKNPNKVDKYLIYYQAATVPLTHISLSKAFTTYTLMNVKSHVTYQLWIVAANDFGKSLPSNKVQLNIEGLPPQPPTNVVSEAISSTKIRIRWSAPSDGPTISGYIIFYKKATDKQYKQIHTNLMSFRLELEENSSYEAYVVSRNKDGTSAPSRTISFTSQGAVTAKHSGDTGPSSTQIGLGIGLTLLVIAIIIVVLLIFYMKFRRGKTGGPAESVSFENPSYGRNQVQISGLPADDMQPSNQFSYGRLEEDNSIVKGEPLDSQYSTINHDSRPEVNGNNPATLPVTTDEIHIHSPGKNESVS